MNATLAQLDYEIKAADYFECSRPEMLPFVPPHCGRILDVGCGGGGFGASLKQTRDVEVWGVEPFRSAADKARLRLDRVIHAGFSSSIALPAGSFDCVMFNDVLEHMIAPEEALHYARTLLAPGGVVVASIPNIRTFPVVWQLLAHGSWEYRDCGLLDKTHLRFFTKSSIVTLFRAQGYKLDTISGLNEYAGFPNVSRALWTAYRVFNVFFLRRFEEMRYQQFVIVASAAFEGGAH